MKIARVMVAVMSIVVCIAAGAEDRKYIHGPKPANATTLPFSDAVLVGNTLYIAGHLGLDAKTGMPPADAADEAKAVMETMKKTIESAGMEIDDVVSLQIFCTDLKEYETFNAVYKTYFHGDYPARAFLGADKLVRGARFEVMGIAIRRGK